jgi:hypothetical protein
MKKLVLHIGFPKTGSSTTQSWLSQLETADLINYAGPASRTGELRLYKELVSGPPNRARYTDDFSLSDTKQIIKQEISLKSDRINVISDVNLTAYSNHQQEKIKQDPYRDINDFYIKDENITLFDPFDIPTLIYDVFSDMADEITILAVVRNQQNLIYSSYVQNYTYYVDKSRLDSWDNYLQKLLSDKMPIAYDFSALLNEYTNIFGQNSVNVLLFEDLVNEMQEFASAIRQQLMINEKHFFDYIDIDTHKNRTRKSRDGSIRNVYSVWGKKIIRLIKLLPNDLRDIIKKYVGRHWNYIESKFLNKDHVIDEITEEQKSKIHNRFAGSNADLRKFGIPEADLFSYGYI